MAGLLFGQQRNCAPHRATVETADAILCGNGRKPGAPSILFVRPRATQGDTYRSLMWRDLENTNIRRSS